MKLSGPLSSLLISAGTLAIGGVFALGAWGEPMPLIHGETLSGKGISLPLVSPGPVTLLCVGFSHASHSQVEGWAERLDAAFEGNGQVAVYSVAVLEGAPQMLRGAVIRAIKHGIPVNRRDHFVILFQHAAVLKAATGYQRPEDAYILLIDPAGGIRWRTHGPLNAGSFQNLEDQVRRALLNTRISS